MDMKITSRLLIMMFVQYFMQGAWNMTMGLVLSSYGMASIIGNAYALLGVATIISPLFIGMVADRFFASQKVMGILHLINAVVILCVPQFIEAQNSGMTLFLILLLAYCFIQPLRYLIALVSPILMGLNISQLFAYLVRLVLWQSVLYWVKWASLVAQ